MNRSTTFVELVDRCGLSPMFASQVMIRALVRAGSSPAQLGPEHLVALLPEVERAIWPFLGGDELERTLLALRSWVAATTRARGTGVGTRRAA
jgi:hypothetical protein